MTGTPSLRTTSAVLPSCRSTSPHASTEPMASPSGRACEVSTKRWFSSSVLSTSLSIGFVCHSRPRLCGLLLSLLHSSQQLIDPGFIFSRTVVVEKKFGNAPQAERDLHRMADISLRFLQTFHGFCCFFFAPLDFHVDARQLAARLHHHFTHRGQADARIG